MTTNRRRLNHFEGNFTSATLSTTNPIQTVLGLDPDIHGIMPVSSQLHYVIAKYFTKYKLIE